MPLSYYPTVSLSHCLTVLPPHHERFGEQEMDVVANRGRLQEGGDEWRRLDQEGSELRQRLVGDIHTHGPLHEFDRFGLGFAVLHSKTGVVEEHNPLLQTQ